MKETLTDMDRDDKIHGVQCRDWHGKSIAASGETGKYLITPPATSLLLALSIDGVGEGYVEYATDHRDDVKSGNATWYKWDEGNVITNIAQYAEGGITAFRAVSVNGTITVKGTASSKA
jgi:hypothetical protein